jgi:SSS family solute:Na+ symporter
MSSLDLSVIAAYAVLVVAVGLRASRPHANAAELQLAGRGLPTWAVLLSLAATELSAATFLGVPHAAYAGTWAYLQFAFGALLGKLVLSRWVIPLYHRLGVVTVYGFLGDRFGPHTRRSAALCFTAGRVLASGVRLFIASLAFAEVTGWRIEAAIAACGLLSALYTWSGGLRAVVWTDVLQSAVLAAGAGAMLVALVAGVDGGLGGLLAWAQEHGRARIFHASPLLSLSDSRPFLVALAGGFFLTLATHGTDHDMVQRLLATRSGAAGARALFGSALLNFPLTALFLAIGTGLACFYAQPPGYDISDAGRIVPLFALHELPSGVRGLLFAGLFAAAMSSLDSAICAIATTWVTDVAPRPATGGRPAARMRAASLLAAGALVGAAWLMSAYHASLSGAPAEGPALSLVELALSAMTILYGGLLGVFGLGFLWRRRGSDRSAVAGLAGGGIVGLALFLHPVVLGRTAIAWTWWIPLGAAVAFAIAAIAPRAGAAPGRGRPRAAA